MTDQRNGDNGDGEPGLRRAEDKSTYTLVKTLHLRFNIFDKRLDVLHADHGELRARVDVAEKMIAKDILGLEHHEAEAALRESLVIQRLDAMKETDDRTAETLEKHTENEERDRRWLMGVVVTTLLGVLGVLGTLILHSILGI